MLQSSGELIPEVELLCLDFDNTIPEGHVHKTCFQNKFAPKEVHAVLTGENIESVPPERRAAILQVINPLIARNQLRNPDDMRDLIRAALASGKKVAIVSFTKYEDVIPPTLKNLGLTDDEVSKVFIRGDYPGSTDRFSLKTGNPQHPDLKRFHIEDAMKHFGISPDDKIKVLLIDDDLKNCTKAEQLGFQAINFSVFNPDPKLYIAPAYEKMGLNIPNHLIIQQVARDYPEGTPLGGATPIGSATPLGSATPVENKASTPLTSSNVAEAFERSQQRVGAITHQQEMERKKTPAASHTEGIKRENEEVDTGPKKPGPTRQ